MDAGGFVAASRVNGILAVTRSLGDHSMKEFVVCDPFVTRTVLDDKDDLLILACDGVWDVMTDQEAVDHIKDEADGEKAAKALLERSLALGTSDNVSVQVLRL